MLMGVEFAAQLESCHSQSHLLRSDINFENTGPNKRDILEGVFHVPVVHSSIATNEVLGLFKNRPEFRAVLFI